MMTIYPYEELGTADFGWLEARYHFSFGAYRNPERRGFGNLIVVNDDRVAAGQGFDMHAHENMEIITYVRQGAITHNDSLGNEGRTAAGDVQVMSAGSGIRHAEYNKENKETTLYQIWIRPREEGIKPRWDAGRFPKEAVNDHLPLLVSGREEDKNKKDVLYIHADAALYGGRLMPGTEVKQTISHQAYLLVSEGSVIVDGETLNKGDGAEIIDTKDISIKATSPAEVIVIDLAS